jgi:phage terminase large subunit GpA-like protein
MTPIAAACVDPGYKRVAAVMATQMGKTAGLLNVIGHKLDTDPAPVLYIGPTKSNVDGVIEPQVSQLLRQSESLWKKTIHGRRAQKLIKRVSGVTLRLAWAGSPTELASQPAHTVLVDEVDRMQPIPGEGDPVTLAEARTATYPDGRVILTSTPTAGSVEPQVHPETGIEHWAVGDPQDIASAIWRFWQEGTRYEWAVPCPHCASHFVPRFKLLTWPDKCTPKRAKREARLACPSCGGLIDESQKVEMNALGVFVAPGQRVVNGCVVGDPPESDTASFWVSGLMSPWRTFGECASEWLTAVRSGDAETIRGKLNTVFGELYRIAGDAPEWASVGKCASGYQPGDVPAGVQRVFITADVQQDRIVTVTRGWGAEFESWLIAEEELWGDTDQAEVWQRLSDIASKPVGGRPVSAIAVDAGFRTDQVFEWVHAHGARAYATFGRESPSKLYQSSLVEVTRSGRRQFAGLKRWVIDSSYFKSWVHERIGRPIDQPGAWRLPEGISEQYCRQIVAEQRIRLPSGRARWVRTSKDNHYLDCEAMQAFLAHVEGVRHLRGRPVQPDAATPGQVPAVARPAPSRPVQRSGWLNTNKRWMR